MVIIEGDELLATIEIDLKQELMTENLNQLSAFMTETQTVKFLGGTVSINKSESLLDEYQLEAYAKYPASSNFCSDGSGTGGPTMADDANCLTYALP
jgi:hypothetical protein